MRISELIVLDLNPHSPDTKTSYEVSCEMDQTSRQETVVGNTGTMYIILFFPSFYIRTILNIEALAI